jgi:hypothetical protein
MLKKRILLALMILLLLLAALVFSAIKAAKTLRRDPSVLMNRYYHLKQTHPNAAKQALLLILKQDRNYLPAQREYQQWLITKINNEVAVGVNSLKATSVPIKLVATTIEAVKSKVLRLESFPPRKLRQRFRNNPPKDHIFALKEVGFDAIAKGNINDAICYFSKAYEKTKDPALALQLAYLYDGTRDKRDSYRYFNLARKSLDKNISHTAENAMTSLAGQQTKALREPYFSEIYFNPFTESRFGLTVRPFNSRLGLEQANDFQTKEYVFFRRTQDNRSRNLGELSQLYEDNVQITGVGGQFTPFKRIPLVGFLELGTAYDIVYQNRKRWRGDARAGAMYYREFGTRPQFFDAPTFSVNYYSDLYADLTYFSRYNNNVIGLIRTRQGIRLFQYHASMLNIYVTGRVAFDTKREFYNNFAEVGPGIAFVPSNRFNFQLRFESIKGVYLPAGAVVNPYPKYYTNQVVQMLMYIKF